MSTKRTIFDTYTVVESLSHTHSAPAEMRSSGIIIAEVLGLGLLLPGADRADHTNRMYEGLRDRDSGACTASAYGNARR